MHVRIKVTHIITADYLFIFLYVSKHFYMQCACKYQKINRLCNIISTCSNTNLGESGPQSSMFI